jgi:hypothetical protein
MDLALENSNLGGTTIPYQQEMNDSLFDPFKIQAIEGCWVPNSGGISAIAMNTASWLTVEGLQRPLSSQSSPTPSKLSSGQSSIFSYRDSVTSITTNPTSSDTGIHADGVPGWPRPITPLTTRDVNSLRLTGEKTSGSLSAISVISETGPTRMKAIAGWISGFIYAQIASIGQLVVGYVFTFN